MTWSIYNLFEFFNNLYTAIGGAQSDVESLIGQIISTMNPPDPTSGGTPAWEYALDALTFGLSLYAEGSVATKALIRLFPQTSSLVTKLYPSGDVSGDVTQWANVAAAVGQFCQTWANEYVVENPFLCGTFANPSTHLYKCRQCST